MIFFSKHSLEEDNDMNNIDNYSYLSNPCLEDENSENDYPQKFTFNKYRTDAPLLPMSMMDYSTALQSNKIFEDIFQDKKEEIENLNDFNNMDNFIQKQEQPKENINVINPIQNNNNPKVSKKNKLGRPSKENASYKGKHSCKAPDNFTNKIIRFCLKGVYIYLQKEIKSYAKSKKVRIRKLHMPTIKKYLVKGNTEKCILLETPVKTLFVDMIPKRVKKEIEKEREKYCHNKLIINKILKIEENDKEAKEKTLDMRFNAGFNVYFKAFLNNEKNISINGMNFILSEEFKTIEDYYKEEKSEFTEKEKEECEEHINKIINRKIQIRTKKKKDS
jgi:hypothetical protein